MQIENYKYNYQMAEMVMERKPKHSKASNNGLATKKKSKKQKQQDQYDELDNNFADVGNMGEVSKPVWMEECSSSDDAGGGLMKDRKNFDLGRPKQESSHEEEEEDNEEEQKFEQKLQPKGYSLDPNLQVSDDDEFDAQFENAQMQAKQKQMNGFPGFATNPQSEFDEKIDKAVHENLGYGEVTGGIANSKRKKKKKQRAEPQIEDANQYKLYNDAQYDQQANDSDDPGDQMQNDDKAYLPNFLRDKSGAQLPEIQKAKNSARIMQNDMQEQYNKQKAGRQGIGLNHNIADANEDDEMNFADRLNRLQEENESPANIASPMVARAPADNIVPKAPAKAAQQNVAQANKAVSDPGAIDQLQEMFPNLDKETLENYHQLCGGNVQKTFNFISAQMGMFQEEEDEGDEEYPQESAPNDRIDPNDVQFNLLAGNQRQGIAFDPNVISAEERKMIEQALRDSEQQERQLQRARQTAQTAPNQVNQKLRMQKSEQEQNMEMIARSEGLHLDEDAKKHVKKVGKGGNS